MERGKKKDLRRASAVGGAQYGSSCLRQQDTTTAKPHISVEQTRTINKLYFFSSLTHLLVATIGQTQLETGVQLESQLISPYNSSSCGTEQGAES